MLLAHQHAIDAIARARPAGTKANPIFSLAKTPATRPSQYPRQRKMILTNCAACAAPLPHKAKQCSRCKTRYCGPACLKAAGNYATTLGNLKRYDEVKSLLRKPIRVARRVLGEGHSTTLTMKTIYAYALYTDPSATLDDLRESVTTLEETTRTARRVLGGAHPQLRVYGRSLRNARAALAARETPSANA